MMEEVPNYFRYWGKAEKGGLRYHLLPYHCLDVAAVGHLLFDPGQPLCKRLSAQLQVSPEWLQQWVTFLLALHDIGKFATAFQGLVPSLSSTLVPANSRMPYSQRHDTLGFVLWQNVLAGKWGETGEFGLEGRQADLQRLLRFVRPWIETVTGHHGEPPKTTPVRHQDFFTASDEEGADHYRAAIVDLFLKGFDFSPLTEQPLRHHLKFSSWMLAGVVVLADWLGSGRSPETFQQNEMPLSSYWQEHALTYARQVVHKANLVLSKPAPFSGINALFPFIATPTPLQKWAESEPLISGNQLFILEDVTGSGKTEAALVLAHRLIAGGLADGVYVALPTMATANAMYARLGKAYRRLFDIDAKPSLILSHGARHLSEDFRNSVGLPESAPAIRAYSDDDEPTETYCSAWLADSRKKALLSEVGVGTLDQALLAVLPARHQSLRVLGLARKVLIVDEAHSYDPYMNKLLQTLIEAHARQGGSVILLSATLPQSMRQEYVKKFCTGAGLTSARLDGPPPYPLATHVPAHGLSEVPVETRAEAKRSVGVVIVTDVDAVVNVIREAMERGQCVCWVRNTVNDARAAYDIVRKAAWMDKTRITLFHSRFAMIDRQRIEEATLDLFGWKSTAEQRRSRMLVATQVVEQSLDLDFDVMISDLAPIDLLVQRAGRLQRHVRDAEGNRVLSHGVADARGIPCFYVFGPQPTNEPTETWLKDSLPGTQAVYQHVGQLWLTQQACISGQIAMPGDARSLIEGVYGECAQQKIPEPLLGLCWNAEGEAGSRRSMASLNALKLEMGYTRSSAEDSGGWDKETRIPTRLGDDSVTVAIVRVAGDDLKPYAEDPQFAWDMSMIDIPRKAWKKTQEEIPAVLRPRIDRLKEEIKILKWVEVFPLLGELERYYDPDMGWGVKEDSDESHT